MMCGTVVGEIRQRRFHHHDGCERPVRWLSGLPRCCRCGGSLYCDAGSLSPYGGLNELRLGGSRRS